MEGKQGGALLERPRVRVGVVLLTSLFLAAAAVLSLLYHDRDLLRTAMEAQIRGHVEDDLGLDYHVDSSRFRLVPLTVILDGVKVKRKGEPWTLSVDRVEVSVSIYSILFQGEGGAKARFLEPRFFQRLPPPEAAGKAAAAAPPALPDLSSLFTARLPIRELDIIDGRVEIAGGEEMGLLVEDVDVAAFLSGGRLISRVGYGKGRLRQRGADWDLGRGEAKLLLEPTGLVVEELDLRSPLFTALVEGRLDFSGRGTLEGSLSARIGGITERLGYGRPLDGDFSFEGRVEGTVDDPRLFGEAALSRPVYRGSEWPDLKGSVEYGGRRLTWKKLAADFGSGSFTSRGWVDFNSSRPRYRLTVVADGIDADRCSTLEGTPFAALRRAGGRLSWEGEGTDWDEGSGGGSLALSFEVDGREGAFDLEGSAHLREGFLEVDGIEAGNAGFDLRGLAIVAPGGKYRAWVEGGTDDLARFSGAWGSADYAGRVSFEGEITPSPGGALFAGPVRWEEGRAFSLDGFDFAADAIIDGRAVSLSDGLLRWRGGEVRADGALFPRTGRVDFDVNWKDLPVAEVSRLLGIDEEVEGTFSGGGRVEGEAGRPHILGDFKTSALRFRDLTLDSAAGAVAWVERRLEFSDVVLLSRGSSLSFAGAIEEEGALSGTLEGESFDLRAFMPSAAADVNGTISGRFGGTFHDPVLEGEYRADRLNYESWSFQESEGLFEYRDGVFSLEGHLAERVNRFLIDVEPRGEWPFNLNFTLGRFEPELMEEAFRQMPGKVREALAGFSFLAIGELRARGNLRDSHSIAADLELETMWLYTREHTLQNDRPIRLRWEGGELDVGDFSMSGEDYRASLAGKAGLESGWDLHLEGRVDLALFQRFWDELEEVDAAGEVSFDLTGDWNDPVAAGTVRFEGGSVKVRSLPDPIVDLKGEGELREGAFTLTGFSGRIGGDSFIAGGKYDTVEKSIDAIVEGRFDLALFRRRLPGAREVKGPVEGQLTLKGPAAHPSIFGEARLLGGEIFLQSMPERVTGLTGVVVMEEKRLELKNLAGRMAGGDLLLNGSVDWHDEPARVSFSFEGRKLLLSLQGAAKALVNADLALTGNFDELSLGGKVDFIKGRFFMDFNDREAREELKKRYFPGKEGKGEGGGKRTGPDFGKMALDVQVSAPDRFWIANSMADVESAISLHLGGTVGAPELDGEVRLLRGKFVYRSQRFTLHSGRIYNTPPGLAPIVEAQAEKIVGDTRIYLLLEGPLRRPKLQLTSNPPRSREDLMSLITVGHTRSTLEGEESEALAIGAALVFTGPLIEEVEEGAREVAGIEIFQVEPTFGDDGGSAKVTVGTRLSDRLYMSASQNVGVTEDQQMRLEYQVIDYLSVVGEQLEQGVYNLGVVLQLDFD